jgi:hypothetical protein
LDWAKNVPAFIPNFKNYIKSKLYFSWRKVLKKEKNGLVAIFVIFFVFNILGEMINKENNYNYFFIVATIITIVNYLILKYLKKYTTVLSEKDR